MKDTTRPAPLIAALFLGALSASGWFYAGPRLLELIPYPGRIEARVTTVPVVMPPNAAAPSWAPTQACGVPDTFEDADVRTAWAPAVADAGNEWLELTFSPMRATEVRIHETCHPGFVTGIELKDADDQRIAEIPVVDPVRTGASVTVVEFPRTRRPVAKVRIQLDTARVAGWNEIDAVELVGALERRWATAATASSYYHSTATAEFSTTKGQPYMSASWSARQVIGGPDAGLANADSAQAWCPRDPDAGAEWLELDYSPQHVNALIVHQSFNPGALIRAELFDADGALLANVPVTGKSNARELKLEFPLTMREVTRVKLHFDTKRAPDYNEIDAVEIRGPKASAYAIDARASSSWQPGDPIVPVTSK